MNHFLVILDMEGEWKLSSRLLIPTKFQNGEKVSTGSKLPVKGAGPYSEKQATDNRMAKRAGWHQAAANRERGLSSKLLITI